MHSAAASPMATSMFHGASSQRRPESRPKKAKNGTLASGWNMAAEANSSTRKATRCPSCPAAARIIDLLTNPLNSGNAAIDAAPTMQKPVVHGMDLYSPPSSLAFTVPVRSSTAPIDMNNRPL